MAKSYPFWKVVPHTFILGAGASRAAFPEGDKYGRLLPLMNDFVNILELREFFDDNSIVIEGKNIEEIYSDLFTQDSKSNILRELNGIITEYFSELIIPDKITIYDELILSLQKKDAIFSFNWDSLILQAYARNVHLKELPSIHFLHGNVGVGYCEKDKTCGYIQNNCSVCGNQFEPSQLLFPITKKEYNKDPFIFGEWEALKAYLENSFFLSIFGYSAPKTDIEARKMMLDAWRKNSRSDFNEIDIVDIKPQKHVEKDWEGFIYKNHGAIFESIRRSHPFLYARRSCESFGDAIMQGAPWKENNLPFFDHLEDLQEWVSPLIESEIRFKEDDIPIPRNQ